MFVIVERDAQSAVAATYAASVSNAQRGEVGGAKAAIRRPYRGIQIKDDTYAVLAVRRANGEPIPLVSESMVVSDDTVSPYEGRVNEYADFIIQAVDEQRVEKQQIIETFGESFVFFFGERPRVITVRGLLVNTEDFNWRSQFWYNYENYLRGTKLVQANARAYLSWDTRVVEGFLLQATGQEIADMPYAVNFSFSMLLSNDFDFSNIGTTLFPVKQGFQNIDVLNQELQARRSEYTSTGADVRFANAVPSGKGVLSAIREGIGNLNEFLSDPIGTLSGGFFGKLNTILGGRNVRLPVGVAGFLSAAGTAQPGGVVTVASGSTNAFFQDFFDAQTGQATGLQGSVKVRLPAYAKFAPVDPDRIRTFFSENYDEYPLRKNPTFLELLGIGNFAREIFRRVQSRAEIEQRNVDLAVWNMMAETQGSIFGTIADVVDITRSGFGVFASVTGALRDFENIISSTMQFGGVAASFSASWQPFNKAMFDFSRAGRLKGSRIEQIRQDNLSRYVGQGALTTFQKQAEELEINPATGLPYPKAIGEVYDSNTYVTQTEQQDLDFEATYADSDYTSVVESAAESAVDPASFYDSEYQTQVDLRAGEAVDAETYFKESGYISQAERSQQIAVDIDLVYGSKNPAPIGDEVSEQELEVLYSLTGDSGFGYRAISRLSPEERLAILRQMMDGVEPFEDEDTAGVSGINDPEAAIEPVV